MEDFKAKLRDERALIERDLPKLHKQLASAQAEVKRLQSALECAHIRLNTLQRMQRNQLA